MSQFQLFPPPSPKPKVSKNPFRKPKGVESTQSASSIPLEDLRKDANTEAVLFKVVEDTDSIKPPPKARIPRSSPVSVPETIPEPRSTESLSKPSPYNDKPERWPSLAKDVDSRSVASSSRTVTSRLPNRPVSPEVPMRSMFPQYNPSLPLSQQQYYPEPSNRPRWHNPRELTLSPPPEIDRALGPKTVPASVMNFPVGVLDPMEIHYSSVTELQSLWEAANGQRPQELSGTFNLPMARINSATFAFGEPQTPFYTMQTYSTDELSITRANPSMPNSSVPIMMLKLEDRRRREPLNDGLVCQLFSRLAAMLAIDEAEELVRQHRLGPGEAAEVEGEALKRAAAQESCRLSWNHTKQLYELNHPSLSRQQPLVGAAGIPLSPLRSKYSGTLHITVSTPSKDSKHHQPPTILVTTPMSANTIESANVAATPRTSTLPLTDTDEPLASLDLGTMTLSISAAAIITTIPSLYAIDSLISAMLAVAVSDESTNPVLADMAIYEPKASPKPSFPSSRFNGKLVATLAEREDAEQGSQMISKVKSAKSQKGQKRWFRPWEHQQQEQQQQPELPKPGKQKNKKIVVEEFDLEKYGRYGHSSSREGQKLPSVTRGFLRLLFWGLNLIVHALTMLVKVIAWLLVNMSRCVTSEKY